MHETLGAHEPVDGDGRPRASLPWRTCLTIRDTTSDEAILAVGGVLFVGAAGVRPEPGAGGPCCRVDGAARYRAMGAGALVRAARRHDPGLASALRATLAGEQNRAEALPADQEGGRREPAPRAGRQPRRGRSSAGCARAHSGRRPRLRRLLLLRGGRRARSRARAGQPRRDALAVDRLVEHERGDRGRAWTASSIGSFCRSRTASCRSSPSSWPTRCRASRATEPG